MFENVSDKLKIVAKVMTVLGVIGGIGLAVFMYLDGFDVWVFPLGVLIGLLSWVSALCLYAFAGILKNTYLINENLSSILNILKNRETENKSTPKIVNDSKPEHQNTTYTSVPQNGKTWTCENCGCKNSAYMNICIDCGRHK